MNLDKIWLELQSQLPSDAGYLRRRIHADSNVDLNLAMINPGQIRAVNLTVGRCPRPPTLEHSRRPEGLSTSFIRLRRAACHGLSFGCNDPAAADVFLTLVADLTSAVARSEDDRTAVGMWIGRLARWQRLLQRAQQGLTPERQRGLFAELWPTREGLSQAIGQRPSNRRVDGACGSSPRLPNAKRFGRSQVDGVEPTAGGSRKQ